MTDTVSNSEDESWVERYRPETWSEIQGNNKSLSQIKGWVENWRPGDKPQLLIGPPGTGKTTTAWVASKHTGYPLNQINASSARKTDDIERMARQLTSTPSDADYQLVLLDEVDSWHHAANKQPLYDALADPKNPIILTANDKYSVPNGIKYKCNTHTFKLQKRSKKAKLREVAKAEGVDISPKELGKLATRPDLRSAIQDLQLHSNGMLGEVDWDGREWDMDEFDAVDNIFRGKKWVGSNITPPDLVMWLTENLSREFRGIEAGLAYEALAQADVNLGRAGKHQDYYYWKFAGDLAERTAYLRLSEAYDGYLQKGFPEVWRHSEPKPDSSSAEAKLYRRLKNYEEGPFQFGGDFTYFRLVLLPLITELPSDVRYQFALNARLKEDEVEALNITWSDFTKWREDEAPEQGEWIPPSQDALDSW